MIPGWNPAGMPFVIPGNGQPGAIQIRTTVCIYQHPPAAGFIVSGCKDGFADGLPANGRSHALTPSPASLLGQGFHAVAAGVFGAV